MPDALTLNEALRFARHTVLPQVGTAGQAQLKAARVLIVGTGGLGSASAMYLAAAGIGHLGLVDYDVVDRSNLQRQIIHSENTIGQLKVESAAQRLRALNPHLTVQVYPTPLTHHNALEILSTYDVIVDGTDNFPTRYLLNHAAILLDKPFVYGSIYQFEGQVSVFGMPDGPCYHCLVPQPPPPELIRPTSETGVFGILPGTIGTLQAAETLKVLLGVGEPLVGRLLLYDALDMSFDMITVARRSTCPVCGDAPTFTELMDYREFCSMSSQPGSPLPITTLTVEEIHQRRTAGEDLLLIDIREPHELALSRLDGSLHIPLSEINARWQEIPQDRPVVVFCHAGVRSAYLIQQLQTVGYRNLLNMSGGIDAWSQRVDPAIPRY